jgi:hypothetical protein
VWTALLDWIAVQECFEETTVDKKLAMTRIFHIALRGSECKKRRLATGANLL